MALSSQDWRSAFGAALESILGPTVVAKDSGWMIAPYLVQLKIQSPEITISIVDAVSGKIEHHPSVMESSLANDPLLEAQRVASWFTAKTP